MSATQMICVVAPIRVWSEANLRGHWRSKAARAKGQRKAAGWCLMDHRRPGAGAITITLTRLAPRDMDSDNLAGGFKAVRDGVADWLQIDDGDKRLTWRYEQRRGKPKEYAAEIRLEWEA